MSEEINKNLLGAIPSEEDKRDYHISMFTEVAQTFPQEFRLGYTEKIKNQGNIGSCVAQSLAYTREITEEKQSGAFKEFSAGFIYGNRVGTLGEVFESEGMAPRDALKNLHEYGDVLLEDFPQNDVYPVVRDLVKANRDELYKKAEYFKITSYIKLLTIDEVKTAIMTLGPVTAMFPIYSSFNKVTKTSPIIPIPDAAKEAFQGYHEMTIVGWRKDNTFIVLNSWGASWGDSGKCYVPFDYPVYEYWSITDKIMPHWAEKYFYYLNKEGIIIHDKRFDEPITRGEVMALLARMKGYK
jgi:C1A family cysteine protease